MEAEKRFEEVVDHLLLHDADLASAVQRIRRAVDEETLDEAVADAVRAAEPSLRKLYQEEFEEKLKAEIVRLDKEAEQSRLYGNSTAWAVQNAKAQGIRDALATSRESER